MRKINVTLLAEAFEFIDSLSDDKAKSKVYTNINRVAAGVRDAELFKKLKDDIWELRTQYKGIAYRLLAFWDNDRGSLIVATHGFTKKTQKTPSKEIEKAKQIRTQYFELKQQ